MTKSIIISAVSGKITAPPSKSVAQRLIAISLLKKDRTRIHNLYGCEDISAALDAAASLGAEIQNASGEVVIEGHLGSGTRIVRIGESGLAMRLFAPIAALSDTEILITGHGTLMNRPMDSLQKALTDLGATCTTDSGFAPLRIKGPFTKNHLTIDGSVGSQIMSGLLIANAQNKDGFTLYVNDLKSKPYADLTLKLIRDFGVEVRTEDYTTFHIPPGQEYCGESYNVEGDWSTAACFAVLAAVKGSITIDNLDGNSCQADKAILEVLAKAGAMFEMRGQSLYVQKQELKPFRFNATDCPDLFPPLVSLASFINGTSIIKGVKRLYHKESDRAKVLKSEFTKLGIDIRIDQDDMIIRGGTLKSATVDSHYDHRIAMATMICAAGCERVTVSNAEAVNKSHQDFFADIQKVGGILE